MRNIFKHNLTHVIQILVFIIVPLDQWHIAWLSRIFWTSIMLLCSRWPLDVYELLLLGYFIIRNLNFWRINLGGYYLWVTSIFGRCFNSLHFLCHQIINVNVVLFLHDGVELDALRQHQIVILFLLFFINYKLWQLPLCFLGIIGRSHRRYDLIKEFEYHSQIPVI